MTVPKKLGKAMVTPECKVIRLVNSNGPDGNYIEFEDGERVDLTDAQWKVELSKLFNRDDNAKMDKAETGGTF